MAATASRRSPAAGSDSVSDKWGFANLVARARVPFDVLYIGDLDPHGKVIFEVLTEDVTAFAFRGAVSFTRIAVTQEQIDAHSLPTDPDHPDVVQAEALPPDILADIVDTAIRDRLDLDHVEAIRQRSADIRADFEARLRAAGLWIGD